MALRCVGHFYELAPEVQRSEIAKLRGGLVPSTKQLVLQFLRSGVEAGIVMMVEYDHLSNPELCLGAVTLVSDGKWSWPSSLAYFVEKYDLALPVEFLDEMASNNWLVPPGTVIPFEMPEGHVAM
jgi:hypothetical protein